MPYWVSSMAENAAENWLLIAFLLSDVILLILVEKGFHSLWLDKRGSNKCHDCTPQRHLFGEIS